MTVPRRRFRLPSVPRPSVLLTAVAATAIGTALRDPGTGLLCAAAVLVLARSGGGRSAPSGWPSSAADPDGQVGHPLVTELAVDLERAEKDGTVLARLARRTQQALALPSVPAVQRPADLQAVLDRSGRGGAG